MKVFLIGMLIFLPKVFSQMHHTLEEKLELRIDFKSNGETVLSQLKRLQEEYKLDIVVTGLSNESLNKKTKKYSYVNSKIKYILRRIAAEAKSVYEVNAFVLQFKQQKTNILGVKS